MPDSEGPDTVFITTALDLLIVPDGPAIGDVLYGLGSDPYQPWYRLTEEVFAWIANRVSQIDALAQAHANEPGHAVHEAIATFAARMPAVLHLAGCLNQAEIQAARRRGPRLPPAPCTPQQLAAVDRVTAATRRPRMATCGYIPLD